MKSKTSIAGQPNAAKISEKSNQIRFKISSKCDYETNLFSQNEFEVK